MRNSPFIFVVLLTCAAPARSAEPCLEALRKTAPPMNLVWRDGSLHFEVKGGDTGLKRLVGAVMTQMARPFWLTEMSQVIVKVEQDKRPVTVHEKTLDTLRIGYATSGLDPANIPKEGALLTIANHPRFGAEGMAIAALLAKVRPDVRIVLNKMNQNVPGFEEVSFGVDMDGNVRENVRTLKDIKQWLKDGHAVIIFPGAGVSAYPEGNAGPSADHEWKRSIAHMVKQTGAPVLPIYSDDARPGFSFLFADKYLRPAVKSTYPQEILRQQGSTIQLAIGDVIPAEKIRGLKDEQAVQYLRDTTYGLKSLIPPSTSP